MANPINHTSGVADRNGTNSHTISFGFTSTAGNFLAFVVAGAVTHAASGWTEQLSPVNSAELSLFTKTSAGDTDITVTHNGSDYPVAWAAWEWAAGTTYDSGTSESANDLTFPTLAGLPGNGLIELGAALCIAAADPGTGPSASWTAGAEGWTERVDSFTAGNGTDGVYLTVATASNATVASTTPSGTFSPINNPPITAADRQKIVWALEVPAVLDEYGFASETDAAMPFDAGVAILDTYGFASETDTSMPFTATAEEDESPGESPGQPATCRWRTDFSKLSRCRCCTCETGSL